MEYVEQFEQFALGELIKESNHRLNYMMEEANFMLESMSQGIILENLLPDHIVTEAIVERTAKGAKSLFLRIVEFIKNVLRKFGEKVGLLTKNNVKWIDDNKEYIQASKNAGVEIRMTPYWKGYQTASANLMGSAMSGDIARIASGTVSNNEAKRYQTVDEVKNKFFNRYVDNNGKLTQGMKNLYRTGNVNKEEETVLLTGNDLSRQLDHFVSSVRSYEKETKSSVQKLANHVTRLAENASRALEDRGVSKSATSTSVVASTKESLLARTSVLEGVSFSETELSYIHAVPVLEKEEKVSDEKNGSNTSVKAVKHRDEVELNHSNKMQDSPTDVVKASKNALSVLQTVLTTSMTMMEETNVAYMNALKACVNAVKEKTKEKNVKASDAGEI